MSAPGTLLRPTSLEAIIAAAADTLVVSLVRPGLLSLDARGRVCRPEDVGRA